MKVVKNKPKRIGIDARFYGTRNKGLGRYAKEIVDHVIDLDRDNEYVVFLRKNNWDEFETNNPRVKKVLVDVRWYTVLEQIKAPFIMHQQKLDLMHFPHFNVPLFYFGKFIVTIHDLILTKHPTKRASTLSPIIYQIKHWAYQLVIKSAIRRSKIIIAVSKFTKEDIANKFKVDKDKIIVIYEGIAGDLTNSAKVDDKKVITGYNIHRPYILYVGNAYPHKNLEGLVRVFSKLREKYTDLSLVLVGKEDYFYNRLNDYTRKVANGGFVVFPGFVPDKDLGSFYRLAESYVFPSLFEGFGLPPLEAMSHGLPVVSSNKTCLEEVLGDAALYFNPDDEEDTQKQIERILEDEALRDKLRVKGKEQIKKYSWKNCASKIIELYNMIL